MNEVVELAAGSIVDGRVIKLLDWGALVALPDGHAGRLSNSQITWIKTKGAAHQALVVGQSIRVIIHEVRRSKAHGKLFITLGYRELQPNPWALAKEKYPEGTQIQGTIIEFLPFGATVEVESGIRGLLHDSEISWTNRDAKASATFQIGDSIPVVIKHDHAGKRKLHFSYRETKPDPWLTVDQVFPVGTHAEGRVIKRVDYGIFVELSNGCVSLLHKSQAPATFVAEAGSVIDVIVVDVDQTARRISVRLLGHE